MNKVTEVTVLTEKGEVREFKGTGYLTETRTYRVDEYWENGEKKTRNVPVHNVTIQMSPDVAP